MSTLEKDGLLKALEVVFNFMQKEGYVSPEMANKKGQVLEQLAEQLKESGLTNNDMHDKQVQKRLMGAIVFAAMNDKKNLAQCITSLCSDERSEKNETLDKSLNSCLGLIMKLLKLKKEPEKNSPSPKPDFQKLSKKMLDDFKNQFGKELNPKQKQELDDLVKTMEDPLNNTLRNLYGGDDPRIEGEIPFPIIGPIMGNLFGIANQTTPNPNSVAYMVESGTYNTNKPDYMGTENILMIADIANDILDNNELNYAMKNEGGIKPSPGLRQGAGT